MRSLLILLACLLAGCSATTRAIDPASVRTFDAPGLRCYELIDQNGEPHFVCVRTTPGGTRQ